MRDHRSLRAWQEAHQLARAGLRLARDHWRPHAAAAFSQLQRASLSVSLNIAEGYARNTRAQFHYGLNVAYGSAVETAEILHLLVVEEVIDASEGKKAIQLAVDCQRMLIGLMRRYRAPDSRRQE